MIRLNSIVAELRLLFASKAPEPPRARRYFCGDCNQFKPELADQVRGVCPSCHSMRLARHNAFILRNSEKLINRTRSKNV